MKYTKKQIEESIKFWESKLKKMDEAGFEYASQDWRKISFEDLKIEMEGMDMAVTKDQFGYTIKCENTTFPEHIKSNAEMLEEITACLDVFNKKYLATPIGRPASMPVDIEIFDVTPRMGATIQFFSKSEENVMRFVYGWQYSKIQEEI